MKRYRLTVALLLMETLIGVSIVTILLLKDYWAQACIVMILTVATGIIGIWHLQSKLINTMSIFVSSLEMNDTTTRVEIAGDRELRKMSEAMNRISRIYRENMRELQTRKLYYDRVLKIMTHEMRNGITPIVAISNDMLTHPEQYKGEKLAEASHLINSQAEGVHRFLKAYYSLTHIPEPITENVKAGEYIKNVKKIYKAELERRGLPEDIVFFTVAEDMSLKIDISLMNQVMINMFRNALDALSGNNEGRIDVILTISDSHPCITIRDNGNGMSKEAIDNLFQPFFTTKKDGNGVGLTISRQIVMQHGGDISIQSVQSKGTTVMISL